MIETAGVVCFPGVSMSRFGKIDDAFGGGNVFRLIWAPSRNVTLMLDRGPTTLPLYAAVEPLANPNVWVLEKWLPPDKVTSLTREEWNASPECLMQGPFPDKGDYVLAALPLTCHPSQANIDKLVSWVMAGGNFSRAQNALAIQNRIDAQERAKDSKRKDMIDDALLPFGGEAYSGRKRGRGTKTVTAKYSAQDLGLPTKSGYSGVSPVHKPVTYKVPLEG